MNNLSEKPTPNSRVAIVGSGAAGLTAACLIDQTCNVDLIEKGDYIGGHTCTLHVPSGPDAGTPVDAGFIVMNHRNYPHFTKLLKRLGVELGDSDMSFGFHDAQTGYAYAGTNLGALFAQRKNIVNPQHLRMIKDILRFNKQAQQDLDSGALADWTLGEYIDRNGFSSGFSDHYLLAMGSAIWSSPSNQIRSFPAESFIHFFKNHGLLGIKNRPQWRYVRNGSRTYVERILEGFTGNVYDSQSIDRIVRHSDKVVIHRSNGTSVDYDFLIMAAHADQSLGLLADPSADEQRLLGAWSYQKNSAVFHSDPTILPKEKAAWASWNFLQEQRTSAEHPVSITYHMNRLQELETQLPYFVSLNSSHSYNESLVWERRDFTHPVYDFNAVGTQAELPRLNGVNRTWFCGSYFGYGFHEDAVRSGVEVAKDFGAYL